MTNKVINRDKYWDILKGITIILVLIGHSIQYAVGGDYFDNKVFLDNTLYKLIYGFHMPLFMFVSGYFFFFSLKKRTMKDVLIKLFSTLYIPILCFSFIDAALDGINYSFSGVIDFVIKGIADSRNTLWFLWAVIGSSLFTSLVKTYIKDAIWVHFLLIVVLYLLPDVGISHYFKFMYPFYLLGYYINKEKILSKINDHLAPIGVVSFILYILLVLLFFNHDVYIYFTKTSIITAQDKQYQLYCDIMRIVIGLVGVTGFYSITRSFYQKVTEINAYKYLSDLGMKSMGLYCFQSSLFAIIPKIDFLNLIYVNIACYFFILTSLSYILTLISQKISVLNKLLLGGR